MDIDISVKIGGEAGQGIQTVGDLLATVCWKTGLYVTVVNDFESRIRGGNSFVELRITNHPSFAPSDKLHILAALTRSALDIAQGDVSEGGVMLSDEEENAESGIIAVPFSKLAKEAGGRIMTNTVVAGAILGLLGAPFDLFEELLTQKFSRKSQEVLDNNLKAARAGFDVVQGTAFDLAFNWEKKAPVGLLIGCNKAVALGALAADCRFAAFYPMSPATGIMTELISLSGDFPLVVEQVEDEIAAVNMIIGASYAGVRAMSATSGGGFSLMTEGLGLAGITETPIVIVNAQRPGPATGLPTRTAQPDLLFSIWASQDEFPRFIFAPGSPAEAFDLTVKSFHLADKYQVPVLLLVDQYLNDSIFTVDEPLKAPDSIERFIVSDADLDDPQAYERFKVTDSGISPRVLPCQGEALSIATGNEHTADGHINEGRENRKIMVDKRAAKVPAMLNEMSAPSAYHEDSETLLVCWGSSMAAVKEAVDRLRADGLEVGCLHYSNIWPFPAAVTERLLGRANRFFMVEQNTSAQLGLLIRQETGLKFNDKIVKYDGRPLVPADIAAQVRRLI